MQALVEQGMRDGAVGFSTGLIYIPGNVFGYRRGNRSGESGREVWRRLRKPYARRRRESAGCDSGGCHGRKEAGVPVQLSHFKIDNKSLWGSRYKSLELLEKYRREGVDVVVDQYPYDRSSTDLGMIVPSWALADGPAAIRKRLADPATRARIVAEMEKTVTALGHSDYSYAAIAGYKPDPGLEGKSITEVAALKGRPKTLTRRYRTVLDMLEKGGAQMVYHSMGEEDVERIMRYPNTAFASDSGIRELGAGKPHPRGYGTNARVFADVCSRKECPHGGGRRSTHDFAAGANIRVEGPGTY